MTNKSIDQMVKARRVDSQVKVQKVLATLDAMAVAGDELQVAKVALRAGVSRRFIYDHPELRAEVERHAAEVADRFASRVSANARVTGASLRADLENANASNTRLQKENSALKRRLSETLGQEVLGELAGRSVIDPVTTANLRVEELEQQLFCETELRRRLEGELEAARALNHEYLARLNKAGKGAL